MTIFDQFLVHFLVHFWTHFLTPLYGNKGVNPKKGVPKGVPKWPKNGHFWAIFGSLFGPLFLKNPVKRAIKFEHIKNTQKKQGPKKIKKRGPKIVARPSHVKNWQKWSKKHKKKRSKTEKNVFYDIVKFQFFQKCHFWTPQKTHFLTPFFGPFSDGPKSVPKKAAFLPISKKPQKRGVFWVPHPQVTGGGFGPKIGFFCQKNRFFDMVLNDIKITKSQKPIKKISFFLKNNGFVGYNPDFSHF